MADTFTMDAGEYARIVADYTDETESPWDDLTGASVTLTGKKSLTASADFTATGTLDAAVNGKVKSCGAQVPTNATAGLYNVTLTITKTGIDGWPQHHPCTLLIRDHA